MSRIGTTFRALRDFTWQYRVGSTTDIDKGDLLAPDHPAVGGAPQCFAPAGDAQLSRLRAAARDPRAHEAGTDFSRGDTSHHDNSEAAQLRSSALHANDRADFLPDGARAHMEHQIREDDDPDARLARYIVATSDREYFRAFAASMRDPVSGGHEWTDKEREAVRRVRFLERAMALGTGTAGGFLVPYELDPNIIISSAGYIDPMRAISRVATTAYNEKRFVTSTGVTSHWYDEAVEVSDDAPALLQPVITCRKAMAFVPVSFELYEDSTIAQQVGAVFADSKAAEEARMFTTGNGTTEPRGHHHRRLRRRRFGDRNRDERPRRRRPVHQPGRAASALAPERKVDDEPRDPQRLPPARTSLRAELQHRQ